MAHSAHFQMTASSKLFQGSKVWFCVKPTCESSFMRPITSGFCPWMQDLMPISIPIFGSKTTRLWEKRFTSAHSVWSWKTLSTTTIFLMKIFVYLSIFLIGDSFCRYLSVTAWRLDSLARYLILYSTANYLTLLMSLHVNFLLQTLSTTWTNRWRAI